MLKIMIKSKLHNFISLYRSLIQILDLFEAFTKNLELTLLFDALSDLAPFAQFKKT